MTDEADVTRHYSSGKLLEAILGALARAGMDTTHPTPADLAPVDEFHIGGSGATSALFERLPFKRGQRLLDIGCGIGGPARALEERFGAHVTGIDLTPEYIEIARELSRRTGQAESTAFDAGSALALPYDDASFDGAITIHVAMNIGDRAGMYAEAARVLKPGATLGIYDVMTGSGGKIDYPTPWAAGPATSHVITPDETVGHLRTAGFEILANEDRTRQAKAFFEAASAAAKRAGGPPAIGLHILTGATHGKKFKNMIRAVTDGRLAPGFIVARKP